MPHKHPSQNSCSVTVLEYLDFELRLLFWALFFTLPVHQFYLCLHHFLAHFKIFSKCPRSIKSDTRFRIYDRSCKSLFGKKVTSLSCLSSNTHVIITTTVSMTKHVIENNNLQFFWSHLNIWFS